MYVPEYQHRPIKSEALTVRSMLVNFLKSSISGDFEMQAVLGTTDFI